MFYLTTHSTHFIYGYLASEAIKATELLENIFTLAISVIKDRCGVSHVTDCAHGGVYDDVRVWKQFFDRRYDKQAITTLCIAVNIKC